MSLRDNELARRQEGKLELRPQPLRVRWDFNELLTSDGHELRATFTCSARVLPDPTERRMFEEVLLGSRYSLTDDDLAAHFERTLGTAAAKAAEKRTAGEWEDAQNANEMVEALRLAAAPVAFGCGVELLPPFHVDLQSPTYQRQRLRTMQQSLAEQQAADRVEHVQRAAELLKQFESIRAAAPNLSPGRVLDQISPADRGAVLQTLLLASAKQRQAEQLWAVAGPYLVRVEMTAGAPPRPQLIPLPPTLGPLRSVTALDVDGQRRLAVGARSGFMLVDPANPAEPQLYADTSIESPLGFNQVVYWGRNGFVASHGDRGIVRWELGKTDAPATAIRPNKFVPIEPMITSESGSTHTAGPRNLRVLDEQTLVFNAGGKLFATDGQAVQPIPTPSAAEIVAILPADERQLVIVHEDGTVGALQPGSRASTCLTRRGARVRAAGALPWLGTRRLLLAGEDGAIQCLGVDDPLVTEYQSPHRGPRVLAGSTDLVAAVSGDRQRLVLWQTWDGRQPLTEVYLTGMTRHRVADIEFG